MNSSPSVLVHEGIVKYASKSSVSFDLTAPVCAPFESVTCEAVDVVIAKCADRSEPGTFTELSSVAVPLDCVIVSHVSCTLSTLSKSAQKSAPAPWPRQN